MNNEEFLLRLDDLLHKERAWEQCASLNELARHIPEVVEADPALYGHWSTLSAVTKRLLTLEAVVEFAPTLSWYH